MFSNFYGLDYHKQNLCCISKSTMKHWQKPDLPWFGYGYWKCMFVGFLSEYIYRSSPLCSVLSVEYLLVFEDVVQSLLNMCFYDVYSLILTEPHTNQT